jgi:hypothetical protein
MSVFQQKRVWFWIAVAATVIVLVTLIVLNVNGNSPYQSPCLILLPVFFVGLIASLDVLSRVSLLNLHHASDAPTPAPLFQRPPPFGITLS